jgi:hypothetical protein
MTGEAPPLQEDPVALDDGLKVDVPRLPTGWTTDWNLERNRGVGTRQRQFTPLGCGDPVGTNSMPTGRCLARCGVRAGGGACNMGLAAAVDALKHGVSAVLRT